MQAITTATKQAVLPEVTTALANRAAQTYIANGIKVVSAHGSEMAVETAGSFLAGKYGGMATKFIITKTGLMEALNGVVSSIGSKVISSGVPTVVGEKLATQQIIQATVSRSAMVVSYSIAGAVIIPVNLLLGWILDNSEIIFKNARLTFAHDLSDEMLAGFEFVVEDEDAEETKFQIADSISYLSALPEPEAGTGYIYSWIAVPESLTESNFFAQQWGYLYKSYRVVCKHFRAGHIVPLISCRTLEDANYVLQYLRNLEDKLNMSEFLAELNRNASYLKDLITSNS